MNSAIISLGSNIDKKENIVAAVRLLAERNQVLAVSSVYETEALGWKWQPSFFNAAVLLRTEKTAVQLKEEELRPIESQLKRVRTENKNGPRTIDLDISWFISDSEETSWVDAELTQFAHVVVPIAEIVPNWIEPTTGKLIYQLAESLRKELEQNYPGAIQLRPDIQLFLQD